VRGALSGILVRTRSRRIGRIEQPDAIALTFDDGPYPRHTVKILSILKRYHVPATFFVVGTWAQRYPALVRRAEALGMEIANHSWSHPYDPPFTSLQDSKIRHEIADTNALLRRLGADPRLFRPPGGSWDPHLRELAADEGTRLVLWDVDPRDWSTKTSPKELTRAVLSRVRPGSIVLLHDGGGDAATTIEALPEIIRGIRERGLGFTTV
jgi:peptidoglycan/xylan/chitin deacetylase (PgdA/CDA1 family)